MAGETLQIEVVEFYPRTVTYDKFFIGTLHVYIVVNGVQIDLRGVKVSKMKNYLFIQRPDYGYLDKEDRIRFPVFMFTDMELSKRFTEEMIIKCREFMRKNYPDYVPKEKTCPDKFRKKRKKFRKNDESPKKS